MIIWKADQEPIKSVAVRKAVGQKNNISVCWLLFFALSKVSQGRDELGQELTSLPAEVECNKKTFKIQGF